MPNRPIMTPREALGALANARENNLELDPEYRRTLTTIVRQAERIASLEQQLAAALKEKES